MPAPAASRPLGCPAGRAASPFAAEGAARSGVRALPVYRNSRLFGPIRLAPLAALTLGLVAARAEIQIERGFLPHDAAPSSFAIGLPGGINFCFDPVRGGLSYAWTGGFLDLAPIRPGTAKFITPARLLGPLVYQESGVAPLRRGDPARVPGVEFTGYTLRDDAVEFRYTVDGTPVRDEIRARPGGTGLIRRLTFEGGADTRWWHVVAGRPPEELKPGSGGTRVMEIVFGREQP